MDSLRDILIQLSAQGRLVKYPGALTARDPKTVMDQTENEFLDRDVMISPEGNSIFMSRINGEFYSQPWLEIVEVEEPAPEEIPADGGWDELWKNNAGTIRKAVADSGLLLLEAIDLCPRLLEIDPSFEQKAQRLLSANRGNNSRSFLLLLVIDTLKILGSVRGGGVFRGGKSVDMLAVRMKQQEEKCLTILRVTIRFWSQSLNTTD